MKLAYDNCLTCAHCGNHEIHHISVDVFHRPEDAGTGHHLSVATAASHKDAVTQGEFMFRHDPEYDMRKGVNPSSRRHGVTVRFGCEHCRGLSQLSIAQHKGSSIIKMEKVEV